MKKLFLPSLVLVAMTMSGCSFLDLGGFGPDSIIPSSSESSETVEQIIPETATKVDVASVDIGREFSEAIDELLSYDGVAFDIQVGEGRYRLYTQDREGYTQEFDIQFSGDVKGKFNGLNTIDHKKFEGEGYVSNGTYNLLKSFSNPHNGSAGKQEYSATDLDGNGYIKDGNIYLSVDKEFADFSKNFSEDGSKIFVEGEKYDLGCPWGETPFLDYTLSDYARNFLDESGYVSNDSIYKDFIDEAYRTESGLYVCAKLDEEEYLDFMVQTFTDSNPEEYKDRLRDITTVFDLKLVAGFDLAARKFSADVYWDFAMDFTKAPDYDPEYDANDGLVKADVRIELAFGEQDIDFSVLDEYTNKFYGE